MTHYNCGKDNPNFGKPAWNRGISPTRETKLKIRKSLMGNKRRLGIPHTEETKEKLRKSSTGNKHALGMRHSEETKKHLSEVRLGKKNYFYRKKHTKETRGKMSKNHADVSGNRNPNWQGGINNLPYGWGFNDKLKLEIRTRDDFTCQFPNCGNRENGKAFLVHHINYNKEDHRKENLITLDNSCHAKTNYNREFWKNYFNQKIKEELNDFTTS